MMKARLLLAMFSAAALCACNSGGDRDRDRDRDRDGGARSERDKDDRGPEEEDRAGGGDTGSASGRTVDPQLAREMEMAVEAIRGQLPIRQGPLSITNVEARGGELIYDMQVPADVDQAGFRRFQDELPRQACANPQARQLFERGGSYTYRLKDSEGEEFRTSVSSC